ncbi:hypothetical protein [Blastococcus sp. URHD0036]|uniref:hypothetical protein n=1 Tax=Blastococcus sp. URHD0036 TaxID=1380356 RepID=UPI0004965EB6|nr:hypothetical protein [Blastococcus sp. URHD0036]
MTTPADARAAEDAFEAALAGRPVPAGARHLTAFTDAVRSEATAPGRPNAALAELLATGLLPDASTRTVGRSARSSRKRPRMILTALVTKFAAAGAVAKASVAGGAVAALALTGAATDVLPLPGDTGVAEAGDTATDDTPTDTVDDTATDTSGDSTDDATDQDDATGDESDGSEQEQVDGEDPTAEGPGDVPPLTAESWALGPQGTQTFSQWVSAGANVGLVRGEVVSCFAQARQDKPNKPTVADCQALAAPPVAAEPVAQAPVQEPVVPTDETDIEGTAEPVPAPTGSSSTGSAGGHGNSGGHGNGNSGSGNGNGNGNGNGGNRGNGGGPR